LSASHCFHFGDTLRLWHQPLRILRELTDGNDHTIVIVDRTFPVWAGTAHMPKVGANIHMLGNPGDLTDLYRHGYIAGMEYTGGKLADIYQLPIYLGDSGSGIFDNDGNLIAVVSFIYTMSSEAGALSLCGSYPLMFTGQQWEEAAN
jgi:V8-like Glu-specific endopeptidase